jgi:quercetin dioxygenase-like cupin family protein
MYMISQNDLPFRGMSHEFIGADHGPVAISVYLVDAPPGREVRPHRHPYDKVVFVREGRARWIVGGETREAGPGDILVVRAGEIHGFTSVGDRSLVQIDVHLNPSFTQEDIG